MSDPEVPEEGGRPMTMWQRLVGSVTSPRAVFADIAEHGGWGSAAIVLCAVNLVLVLAALPKIEAFTALTLARIPTPLPAAARQVAMTAATVSAVAGSVAGPLLRWLVLAVVILIFGLFTGQGAKFGKLYAVSVFAWVPATIGTILKYALVMVRPVSALTSTTISLGAFFPAHSAGVLYRIAGQISPFTLWSVLLLALGGAYASKTGFGKMATYLLGLWVVVILVVAFLVPIPKGFGM